MGVAQHKGKLVGGSAIILVTASLTAAVHLREGVKYKPYRDTAGIWTVCGGVTGKDVVPGKTYAREECDQIDGRMIEYHGDKLTDCIKVPVTQNQYEALASWGFNIGVGAGCKSTVLKLLNAGEPPQVWCNEMMAWTTAWNAKTRRREVNKGLENRRRGEVEQCLRG